MVASAEHEMQQNAECKLVSSKVDVCFPICELLRSGKIECEAHQG